MNNELNKKHNCLLEIFKNEISNLGLYKLFILGELKIYVKKDLLIRLRFQKPLDTNQIAHKDKLRLYEIYILQFKFKN